MFERYSFVAITTRSLEAAKEFWVTQLGFHVTEEGGNRFVILDVGGLRLCVDLEDGDVHKVGGTDPVIGLKVASLEKCLVSLRERGIVPNKVSNGSKNWASISDPDGRSVILTEGD